MKAKKVLFITSEMTPFVSESALADKGLEMPQAIQELGHEIRTFSPNWGTINERRNQLHEVIRLSGMNIIIDETDHTLVIKVASIQSARMQIYFIDNDDYFTHRKLITDDDGNEYTDNGERAIFYARGVLETVKKLRWVPDIIHCHGWIASLAPLYIKRAYQDEPSFCDAKVVYSATAPSFKTNLGETFQASIPFRNIKQNEVSDITTGPCTFEEMQMIAVKYADGLIVNDKKTPKSVIKYAKEIGKPVLPFKDDYQSYSDFYEKLMP